MGADAELNARRTALRGADSLVFVCSGNMVRSAFAELYARHLGFPRTLRSAASTYRNEGIFPETALALDALGVAADEIRAFRPTHIEDLVPTLSGTPVFLGMRRHHLAALAPWPEHAERAFLLVPSREIADPVLEGADFAQTFAAVAGGVRDLLNEISRNHGG